MQNEEAGIITKSLVHKAAAEKGARYTSQESSQSGCREGAHCESQDRFQGYPRESAQYLSEGHSSPSSNSLTMHKCGAPFSNHCRVKVRLGSLADITADSRHVRSFAQSKHWSARVARRPIMENLRLDGEGIVDFVGQEVPHALSNSGPSRRSLQWPINPKKACSN
jgi:hypothetical protein